MRENKLQLQTQHTPSRGVALLGAGRPWRRAYSRPHVCKVAQPTKNVYKVGFTRIKPTKGRLEIHFLLRLFPMTAFFLHSPPDRNLNNSILSGAIRQRSAMCSSAKKTHLRHKTYCGNVTTPGLTCDLHPLSKWHWITADSAAFQPITRLRAATDVQRGQLALLKFISGLYQCRNTQTHAAALIFKGRWATMRGNKKIKTTTCVNYATDHKGAFASPPPRESPLVLPQCHLVGEAEVDGWRAWTEQNRIFTLHLRIYLSVPNLQIGKYSRLNVQHEKCAIKKNV